MVWDPSLCYDVGRKRSATQSVSVSDMLDLEPLVAEGPVTKKVCFPSLTQAPASPHATSTAYEELPTMTFEELFGGSANSGNANSDTMLSDAFDDLLVADSTAALIRKSPSPPQVPRGTSTPVTPLFEMPPLFLPETYEDVPMTKHISQIRHAGVFSEEGGVMKWMQTLARD